jgi:hypothetical protein
MLSREVFLEAIGNLPGILKVALEKTSLEASSTAILILGSGSDEFRAKVANGSGPGGSWLRKNQFQGFLVSLDGIDVGDDLLVRHSILNLQKYSRFVGQLTEMAFQKTL